MTAEEMRALVEAQAQRIAELERVVVRCRDQFDMYASLHKMKGTKDGLAKAKTNDAFANDCREVLLFSGALATAQAEQRAELRIPVPGKFLSGSSDQLAVSIPVTAQAVTPKCKRDPNECQVGFCDFPKCITNGASTP